VRELARRILERREYDLVNEIPIPDLPGWLRRLLAWIGVLRTKSPPLYWAFVAGLLILVLAATAQIVQALRAALRAQSPRLTRPSSIDEPADLEGEASQLAGSGRFLEAAHRLMIACFGLLAERAVIELRPDRANRWIRSALRGSALAEPLAIEVGSLVERTERRWFGNRDNEPDIYFQWRSLYQRLQSPSE
jgi:hypothetical protein